MPGNFGLLEPSPDCGTGAPGVAKCIAQIDGQTCYSTLVELKTGQNMGYVKSGINVRFDMYQNPGFKSEKNDPNYPPAPNVTKGKFKQGQKYVAYEDLASPPVGMPMPTHPCYSTSTCADPSLGGTEHPRFAPPPTDDQWSVGGAGDDTYWEINHGWLDDSFNTWKSCALCPGGGTNIDSDGDGTVTRQEMYAWENDNTMIAFGNTDGSTEVPTVPDATDEATASSATGENGNPMVYTGSGPQTAGRRVIPVAVLNCVEFDIRGGAAA